MRASPDTWMPLVIAAYLADTQALSTEGHGAYLLILMAYWINGGPLPDDDDEFAAITKLGTEGWRRWRPKMERFFVVEGGFWRQKRADLELDTARARHAAHVERSAKGNAAKAAKKESLKEHSKEPTGAATEDPSLSLPTTTVVPQKATPSSGRASARDQRGARLPADWSLSPELRDWSISEARAPPADVEAEVEKFRDHWKSASGQNAKKLDWDAAWRNWLRNSKEFKNAKRGGEFGTSRQREADERRAEQEDAFRAGSRGELGGIFGS